MITVTRRRSSCTLGSLLVALPLLLQACGTPPGTATPAPATAAVVTTVMPSSTPLAESQQCGKETAVTIKPGQGKDAAARDCLLQAYRAGRPARFMTTAITAEGDPITFDIDVVAPGWIEVTIDSADKYGARGIFYHICTTMDRQLAQSGVLSDPASFRLSGCDGAGRDLVTADGQLSIP